MIPRGIELDLIQVEPERVWVVKYKGKRIGHLKRVDKHTERVSTLHGLAHTSPSRDHLLNWLVEAHTDTATRRIHKSLQPNPWDDK